MKNYLAIILMFSVSLYAMDFIEDSPLLKDKLQLNISNQHITSVQFAQIIKNSPKLHELKITGHSIDQMLRVPFFAHNLNTIDLSHGALIGTNTLECLLTLCPQLQKCSLAYNELTTLDEHDLPRHMYLMTLDVSNNQIEAIDFTKMRERCPSLNCLNVSDCPLTAFNTDGMVVNDIVPTVHLKNTQLSDAVKKNILKNACVLGFHGVKKSYADALSELLMYSAFCGSDCGGLILVIPLTTKIGLSLGSNVLLGVVMGSVVGGAALGAGMGYLCSLGCVAPEDRELSVFKPIFDTIPMYTEEEVTTRYQRFIRNFPYICNIIKCGKSKTKSEYTPLNEVCEQL